LNEFRLVIPGEPVAKARPKLGTVPIGGGKFRATAFTPTKTRRYEDVIRNVVAPQWSGRKLLAEVPITIVVDVYKGIPSSWPKKRQQAARANVLRPISKPDWDNYGKSVVDGMNGVVYLDDALIVDAHVRKWYADEPRVEVTLRWPEAEGPALAIPQELSLIPPEPPLAKRPPRTPPPDLDPKPF
jgi:Holliday junction resolvase RusA-like endonuclease